VDHRPRHRCGGGTVTSLRHRPLPAGQSIDLIDEAASAHEDGNGFQRPEVMDKLERRMNPAEDLSAKQLKKEKDEGSKKRYGLIESEIKILES